MDNNEKQQIVLNKDAQIQVQLNREPIVDEVEIDLGQVFINMKKTWRIFSWVILLALILGVSIPLLIYQFKKEPLKVSSVVTLKYTVDGHDVTTLTAPDGSNLDLTQVTSSFVLENALKNLKLSEELSLEDIKDSITIEKILTEESRRQQEIASSMLEEKNDSVYETVQAIDLKYINTFVVSLTNRFGKDKIELQDEELRTLLDRILTSYNDYLVLTYSHFKLPDNEIAAINFDDLEIMEGLDQLDTAVQNLQNYCSSESSGIKSYRSCRTGMSLQDWIENIETVQEVNIDYLNAYVYANSIVKDKDQMITRYEYQLRNAKIELDSLNENITTVANLLKEYKNDEIFVSMQGDDSEKVTTTTTDYYNNLILQQRDNLAQAKNLKITITRLEERISKLESDETVMNSEALIPGAEEELANAVKVSSTVFGKIYSQLEEIVDLPLNTRYTEHSVALGKQDNFLVASKKNIIIGVAIAFVLSFGIWFLNGLAPEFSKNEKSKDDIKKKDGEDNKG